MALILSCAEENDLWRVLWENRIECLRYNSAKEAVARAPNGSGIMVLADGYPDALTAVDDSVFDAVSRKGLRLYIEYPATLPDLQPGEPRRTTWERAVVCSDAFVPELANLQILMIHGCCFLPVPAPAAHVVVGRVAGFDRAVYGLPEEVWPILFEHPRGDIIVSTTKLSQFVTGRYAPYEAFQRIWQWILGSICPGKTFPSMKWQPAVRPYYRNDEWLPDDSELRAVRRGTAWFRGARLFVDVAWQDEARRRLDAFPDGTGPGPGRDWPVGDGSCGMLEGASSSVYPDGRQNWRYWLRNDCMGEASMAMALSGALCQANPDEAVAANLNDFIYFTSELSKGPRADAASPTYGLVCWTCKDANGGVYYGDDNARSMLGAMATAAVLNEARWDEPLLRCLLANLRTTGKFGFRGGRLEENTIQQHGWQHYWNGEVTNYAPHYESWLWACFLWAYRHTGFAPFLERAKTAIRMTVVAYPDQWRWTNGMQQERARMLLPLAWLVRVEDTQEHREWLRAMAEELLAGQDACGAIREEVGSVGKGQYGSPKSNAEYGASEALLIQENGDPLCDLLYTTNFAFAGLHEAAAATGDAFYADAEQKLARFLCRIQACSETHPELEGAWFRAFDFKRWDYWASNADAGWGAWSIEAGWTQAWVVAVLALRCMKTSFWELTAHSQVRLHLDKLLPVMLPAGGELPWSRRPPGRRDQAANAGRGVLEGVA